MGGGGGGGVGSVEGHQIGGLVCDEDTLGYLATSARNITSSDSSRT